MFRSMELAFIQNQETMDLIQVSALREKSLQIGISPGDGITTVIIVAVPMPMDATPTFAKMDGIWVLESGG